LRRILVPGGAAALVAWVVAGAVAAGPSRGQPLPPELGRAMDSAFDPGVPRQMFLLAIGSDARPGQSVTRSRADSLHIIGVNPGTGTASILGIPRDAYVEIPGSGADKINASLFRGGPELTVRTVERLTGMRIDAYLLTAFEGFRRMVTKIDGLEVRVPYPMSDSSSGAHFRAGPARFDGPEALAFSRNRHDAPGGDFGRSLNQGEVMVAALRELQEDARKDPIALYRWMAAGFRHLRTDLGLGEMFDLALAAMSIDPSRVRNRVVSGGGGTVGGQSVVRLGAEAQRLFRDLSRDGMLGGR
jgi:polyisoprenyl-teichoic acid--peptidoglycan teichoic acid transferase